MRRSRPRRGLQTVHRGTAVVRIQKNITSLLQVASATTAIFTGFSYAFTLDQFLPSASTFYEMYRIAAIRIRLIPKFSQYSITSQVAGTTTPSLPMVYARFDPDDVATPTALSQFLESNNYQSFRGEKIKTFYYKPNYLVASYVGGVGGPTPSMIGRRSYLSTTYPNVNHLGFKIGIATPAGAAAQLFSWEVEVRAYIMLKGAV